jgi:transposase
LVENKVISTGDIAYVLGMSSKKLNRWYKHVLSGYRLKKEEGELHKHDYKQRGEVDKIRVPIVAMHHYGKHLAIDEKHIRGRYHTVLSNGETGKIILLARTIKARELYNIVRQHFSLEQMMAVEVVTKDGAEAFDWLARQAFPNAAKVLDKFHVLQWVFDGLQKVRLDLKDQHIIDQHEAEKKLKESYQIAVKKAKSTGEKVKKADYKLHLETLDNGETVKELLHRSRYLLYKYPEQWNEEQEKRAQALFDRYPTLEKIYMSILKFRTWYAKENVGNHISTLKWKLMDWIIEIRSYKIKPLNAIANTINRHFGQIINYFITVKPMHPQKH